MFVVLALILIIGDKRWGWVEQAQSQLGIITAPFYWLTAIPDRIGEWGETHLVSREMLLKENQALKSEAVVLRAKLQKMISLSAENVRLRELLNSSALLQDSLLVAELISVSPDPVRQLLVVNKGLADGVSVGQPVIDAYGLTGQVVEVSEKFSRVLLLTDATHALPVQVNRNGVRAVAEGVGLPDQLELRHVAATTDIQVGDLLVSSGLGGVFPVGYPVATVTDVTIDPGRPFAEVLARPLAQLDRSRHLLLVFTETRSEG